MRRFAHGVLASTILVLGTGSMAHAAGYGPGGYGEGNGASSPTSTPSSSIPAKSSARHKQIVATEANGTYMFSPKTTRIKAGTKVVWKDTSDAPHTVTGSGRWSFKSTTFSQGQSVSFIFKRAGTYTYKCSIHPYMTAKVVVTK